jgi:hypothetical protein
MRSLCEVLYLSPDLLGSGPVSGHELKESREPEHKAQRLAARPPARPACALISQAVPLAQVLRSDPTLQQAEH